MPRVIHFEIHASDPERAAQFYARVFDWEVQKWDGPEDYWLITTGPDSQPGINGAIFKRRGEIGDADPVIAFVCTIDVPNLDQSIEKVKQHGGHVALQKMPVPGVGWMAYCKDTEGNIFGMMQADPDAA